MVRLELNKIIAGMQMDGCQITHFTCHCLRHTFATRAIESGMNPQTLKSLLGHANLSETMDLYSHVMPDTQFSEMKNMEEYLQRCVEGVQKVCDT